MGTAEFDGSGSLLTINSHIVLYGAAASDELTTLIRDEIETMWNEPQGTVESMGKIWKIRFCITAAWRPDLTTIEVLSNTDPRNNYFRIEEKSSGNISFVDGLGCNTGYFQADNLYPGSTTAAHEYGHTLGLPHPRNLDIRGEGTPGIMYPRGTLVDAQFQYNPTGRSGDSSNGGTMHPRFRRVLKKDIELLRLHKLAPDNPILGGFSSVWHDPHFS